MDKGPTIETERLVLRRWRASDLEPFAALNADSKVMEYFPYPLEPGRSDAFAEHIEAHFDTHGFGLWAVEVKGGEPFIGFVGIRSLSKEPDLPFEAEAEVGWRLAYSAWGRGYAPEAARASLEFGFCECELGEVVSFTTVANERSQRVMQKIGMRRDPAEDFDHLRIEPGSPIRRHVLYRLTAGEWREAAAFDPAGEATDSS